MPWAGLPGIRVLARTYKPREQYTNPTRHVTNNNAVNSTNTRAFNQPSLFRQYLVLHKVCEHNVWGSAAWSVCVLGTSIRRKMCVFDRQHGNLSKSGVVQSRFSIRFYPRGKVKSCTFAVLLKPKCDLCCQILTFASYSSSELRNSHER